MSETSTPEERTEDPTERRIGELRKRGALHFSMEITHVASLVAGFLILKHMCANLFADMREVIEKSFALIGSSDPITPHMLRDGFIGLLYIVLPDIVIIALVIAVVASLAVLLQTKWNIKERKIDFKFLHLNPIAGIKRIFSVQGYLTTLKAIVKLAIILPIGYFALKRFAPTMINLIHMGVPEILAFTATAIEYVFWKIIYILFAIAIFDYFWGKKQWLKMNRMTKAEVKDEMKSIQGDEQTKRRIQMKGLARIMQRIKSTVPKADVVVTNPTHYAVALKYDRTSMAAPIVLAKGKGFLALRIRSIAKEAGVPVLERKPLARALYASAEVGAQIPYELFKAVAEVLAYVYRLKGPRRMAAAASAGSVRK
ncbi:MAG: EscU/YscU/HrcU family type III secretion system export apparatus switch protein [Deltaproteobacteria bacterium]|nr:EscU/YscU/HrcU family type III secretion system export apparatus switch protein [Deltaproteobacteria bacterium]